MKARIAASREPPYARNILYPGHHAKAVVCVARNDSGEFGVRVFRFGINPVDLASLPVVLKFECILEEGRTRSDWFVWTNGDYTFE